MREYVQPMEEARAFRIGTLSDEVEFSIAEYKKGIERISEKEKNSLLAAKEFLEEILNFERSEMGRNGERTPMSALPKLQLLEASGSIGDAWIKSEIPFPKSDEEFERTLQTFIETLESIAMKKTIEEIGEEKVINVEKLFFTLAEITLRKVHVSPLYDR